LRIFGLIVLLQVDLDVGVIQSVSKLLTYIPTTSTSQSVSCWKMLSRVKHQNSSTGRRSSRRWLLESLWTMWGRCL